jgi:hypothetical protein
MTFSKFLNFLVCTLNSSLNSTLRLLQFNRADWMRFASGRHDEEEETKNSSRKEERKTKKERS